MKSIVNYLFLISILFITCNTSIAQDSLIGHWEGEDQGEVGNIHFNKNGIALFIFNNDTLGGDSFTIGGHEAYLKYTVEYSEEIHALDFIIYLKDNDVEVGRIPCIIRFENEDNIFVCMNFNDESRPTTFDEGDTILMTRIPLEKNE
ncbi:hypothetical protein [Brumimicrobium sp.]|uniref:hypothetical protein n=1 Tax=Brumimicrobium sp. TaxID=2029867 RepID=UPI003A91140F